MASGMEAVIASMAGDQERLAQVAHNLSNLGTAGYKSQVSFSQLLTQSTDSTESVRHAGSNLARFSDVTQGALTYTGNPLDLAVEGGGFFEVQTTAGKAYTRDGRFSTDANGRLVTADGLAVLGVGGGEIFVLSNTPKVDLSGTVFEGERSVGQVKQVVFSDPKALQSLGNGLYSNLSGEVVPVAVSRVRQGFLENSNVSSTHEMLRVMETMRRFETNQRMLSTYDEILDRAISKFGEFQA